VQGLRIKTGGPAREHLSIDVINAGNTRENKAENKKKGALNTINVRPIVGGSQPNVGRFPVCVRPYLAYRTG